MFVGVVLFAYEWIFCAEGYLTTKISGISGFTVLLKRKLTLNTQTSRPDPQASMLETFEEQVLRIKKQEILE